MNPLGDFEDKGENVMYFYAHFLKDSINAPNLHAGGFSGLKKRTDFMNVEKRWVKDVFISVINELDAQIFTLQ